MTDKWTDRTQNKPTILLDNGHGTRVKLWTNTGKNGDFESFQIESGYVDGDGKWVAQKVTISKDQALAIARAFEKGHDIAVEKEIARQAEKSAERAVAA